MFEKYPMLKDLYQSPSNATFEVFYLDKLSARKQFLNGEFESL